MEKLLEKIENDAREEGRRIVAEAEAEAERIREAGEAEARREGEAILNSFRSRADSERLKILSQARLEGRIGLLAAKDQLIGEVLEEVTRSFLKLPGEKYRAWLKGAVLKGAVSGEEEVVASPYDRDLLAGGLLEELNRELQSQGKRGELRLAAETAPFERGVILRGEKTEINISIDAVLQRVWAESEEDVSRLLFGAVKGGFS